MKPLRLLACLLPALAACGTTVTLSDDFSYDWSFAPFDKFTATLHSPYVVNTAVSLSVTSSDDHQDFTGWQLESSDGSVFAIDSFYADKYGMYGSAHTAGAGTARLSVVDAGGKELGARVVEAATPDRVELDAHAYLIIGENDLAPVDEVRILENGTATYLVRYFNAGRELTGNGILSVNSSAQFIGAHTTKKFLDENREWLQLTATATDQGTIEMVVNGVSQGTLPVVVAQEPDMSSVAMLSSPEKGHKDGDWLVAYAQAYDAQQHRVFGVDYTWNVAGVQALGDGDLYRYEYKKGDVVTVIASRGTLSDSTTIQSDGGYVDSSNNLGCAAGGGSVGVLVGLAGIALVARRRRAR